MMYYSQHCLNENNAKDEQKFKVDDNYRVSQKKRNTFVLVCAFYSLL